MPGKKINPVAEDREWNEQMQGLQDISGIPLGVRPIAHEEVVKPIYFPFLTTPWNIFKAGWQRTKRWITRT